MLKLRSVLVMAVLVAQGGLLTAQVGQSAQNEQLVPQHLLGLVHAPEIHKELELNSNQVAELEKLFKQIDGPWFRSRILRPEQQRPIIADLEGRVREWFSKNATEAQLTRLNQLEFHAQGSRSLLRSDVAQKLGMTASQQQKLADLATATDEAAKKLQQATMRNQPTKELEGTVSRARKAERNAMQSVLKPAQVQKLGQLVGKSYDTTMLTRVYPMAPELVPVSTWINSEPLSLEQLRGKVVVVHFYAFQCHNCHANFGHYTKWHDEFDDDEVVVIGIQTPETRKESDPVAVEAAAKKRGLDFPILVDLEKKNWNEWSNTMWPTVYIIDKNGYLRLWWQGELNWKGATGDKKIHQVITDLLSEETN